MIRFRSRLRTVVIFAMLGASGAAEPGSGAGAAGITGTLDGAPWTAVQAAIEPSTVIKPGKVWIRVSAKSDKQAALLVAIPKAVGTYEVGKDASVTMFVPPGTNEGAEDGTVAVTEVRQDGGLALEVTVKINDKDHVAGSIVATPAP